MIFYISDTNILTFLLLNNKRFHEVYLYISNDSLCSFLINKRLIIYTMSKLSALLNTNIYMPVHNFKRLEYATRLEFSVLSVS